MTATVELPTTKTGLKDLGLKKLIDAATALKVPGAVEMTKTKLIEAIMAKQAKGETKPAEKSVKPTETKPEPAPTETKPAPAEKPTETKDEVLEIPDTPESLQTLPTWIYVIGTIASTNLKRAFGAVCAEAGVTPTVAGYEAFRTALKSDAEASVGGIAVQRVRAV